MAIRRSERGRWTLYGSVIVLGAFVLGAMAYMLLQHVKKPSGGPTGSAIKEPVALKRPVLSPEVMRKLATALDPDIMGTIPSSSSAFVPGMKNPCWEHEGSMRCLPYVYLAGSFQAGVDTFFKQMIQVRHARFSY